jgi:hypothetical protein
MIFLVALDYTPAILGRHFPMQSIVDEEVKSLCQRIQIETDAKKFFELIKQLTQLLEQKQLQHRADRERAAIR